MQCSLPQRIPPACPLADIHPGSEEELVEPTTSFDLALFSSLRRSGAQALLWRGTCSRRLDDRPEVVVEVGSGTGLAGLAAAAVGTCRVVLTDRPHVVPRLQQAIERNAAIDGLIVAAA